MSAESASHASSGMSRPADGATPAVRTAGATRSRCSSPYLANICAAKRPQAENPGVASSDSGNFLRRDWRVTAEEALGAHFRAVGAMARHLHRVRLTYDAPCPQVPGVFTLMGRCSA